MGKISVMYLHSRFCTVVETNGLKLCVLIGANTSWKQFLTKKAKLHDHSELCKLYQSLNTETTFSRLKPCHKCYIQGSVYLVVLKQSLYGRCQCVRS